MRVKGEGNLPSVISCAVYGALALTVFLDVAVSAQTQLTGRVQVPGGHPVAREYVRIDGGGSYKTDDNGEFGFYLVGSLKVGHPATFRVDHSNSQIKVKSWVVISPCDNKNGRKDSLPDVGSEPITIVVLPWGDHQLMAQGSSAKLIGCIIEELASQFRPAATRSDRTKSSLWEQTLPLQPRAVEAKTYSETEGVRVRPAWLAGVSFRAIPSYVGSPRMFEDAVHDKWNDLLVEKANDIGLSAPELAKRIGAWNKAATGSYEKGLAALYEGRYSDASRYIRASLKSSGREVLKRYIPLARAEYEQAHYAAAEEALRKVLAVHGDDPLVINILAIVLSQEAKYKESEALAEQGVELARSQDPEELPTFLNNLGQLYYLEGRYDDAMKLYVEALSLDKEAGRSESPEYAIHLNNIAELHIRQGQYGDAEAELEQALKIETDIAGPDTRNDALFLSNLGQVYYGQDNAEKAAKYTMAALVIEKKALGRKHPDVAMDLNNLALAYTKLGKNDEAEQHFKEALTIYESVLGAKHPHVANVLNNLAALYYQEGRKDEAESRFEQALAIDKQSLGPDHPDVAVKLNNLAVLYLNDAKYDKAEALLLEAINIKKKTVGPESPAIVKSLVNLARLYDLQRRYAEELPLLTQAFDIDEKAADPFVDVILGDLERVLHSQGRDAEVKDYEERAARVRSQQSH